MKTNDPEHSDQLEAKGQARLGMNLGPREVPKRRVPKGQDKGHADLPLLNQPDDRQIQIPVEKETD